MLATVAMHINYGNRGEADAEAAFVRAWCERHGILYVLDAVCCVYIHAGD